MRQSVFLILSLIFVGGALLAGCGSLSLPASVADGGGNGVLPPGATPKTRYDLANGCYALKSVPAGKYAARSGDRYAATAASIGDAEAFFMKPTALGKYIFYARDKSMLAANNGAVGIVSAPSDAADWTIDTDAGGNFTVFSASAGRPLAVAADTGKLILIDAASAGDPGKFGFDAATNCTPYPEAQVNASGQTFK